LVCRADFPLDGVLPFLQDLARLEADLTMLLVVPGPSEPIELYLFHDQAIYARYLHRYFPEVPYRRAMYVKGRGPGQVFAHYSPQFATDVRHEYTHALLHASLPTVPLWLDEGLASYFELPVEQRFAGSPHWNELRWNARSGVFPNLEELEKKGDLSQMGRPEYRDAWGMVHFMLHGPPQAREELVAYLAVLRSASPPGPLSVRLYRRLPALQQLLAAHFAR
jgi:hypothetical protein